MHTQSATRRTDVLVIGGGLAGCAAAYYLARAGTDVLLVERRELNTMASGCNAGGLHVQIPHAEFVQHGDAWGHAFAPTIPLLLDSMALWRRLSDELEADLEVQFGGGLMVAETAAQLRDIERKAAIERAHGLATEILSRDDLRRIAPYVSDRMVGGSLCAAEGQANPLRAAPAFARAAERHGATVLRDTEVTGLSPDGRAYVAQTEAGPIRAEVVVNSAGAAAGRIAAMLGLVVPIEGEPIQVSVTEKVAKLTTHLVQFAGAKLSFKQASSGGLLIGGGWPARWSTVADRPVVDLDSLIANLGVAARVVPAVAGARLLRTWPAVVNGTADWKPILGEAPGLPGFFLNMFPWMGFSGGPVAGRTVAEMVLRRNTRRYRAPSSHASVQLQP